MSSDNLDTNRDETHGNCSSIPGMTAFREWIDSAFRSEQHKLIRMMHIRFHPASGSMLLIGWDWWKRWSGRKALLLKRKEKNSTAEVNRLHPHSSTPNMIDSHDRMCKKETKQYIMREWTESERHKLHSWNHQRHSSKQKQWHIRLIIIHFPSVREGQ